MSTKAGFTRGPDRITVRETDCRVAAYLNPAVNRTLRDEAAQRRSPRTLARYVPLMRALLLALTLLPSGAQALDRDITSALQTVGGIYSSIYIHEFGHALAYKVFGATDIAIEVPPKGKILGGLTTARHQTPFSTGQLQFTAATGLLASSLSGEIVLQRRGLHRSPYAQAMLGTAVISNLRHTYTYYTRILGRDGYTGNDIDHFEQAGGNPHLFSAALVSYAAWTLCRMRKEGIPLFYVDLHF